MFYILFIIITLADKRYGHFRCNILGPKKNVLGVYDESEVLVFQIIFLNKKYLITLFYIVKN